VGYFTDIHSHMLSGVDDGAHDDNEMFLMLDMAYKTGTRRICLTPHFNPEIWGDNNQRFDDAFTRLSEYAAKNYPDMSLYTGNEICYSQSSIGQLNRSECKTLNGGKHVLVDFHPGESYYTIRSALFELLGYGYIPVLAHAERCGCIKLDELHELSRLGVVIQLSALSLTGKIVDPLRKKAFRILKEGLADVVASDAHNITTRPPCLDGAAKILSKLCGESYAGLLLRTNPDKILGL
jgi:protein-tyrosine phosphatase